MIYRSVRPLNSRSFFLFGPRGVGKSTWIRHQFPAESVLYLDLLDRELQDDLLLHPSRLGQMLQQTANLGKTVVIDEIQKLPKLLDTVHEHIERYQRKFILTGSSARRLKQQGANLLAGRASVYDLFPFSTLELGKDFSLSKALEFGGLPSAYLALDEESKEYLNAYVLLYLEKEIQQEQWVRKIEPFRRFLAVAAQMNGKVINRAKIAREVGVDNATIASYYEILEDTLMGLTLPAFDRLVRKSQGKTPKFYFIDPGIKRAIDKTLRVPLVPGTAAFGEAFEHWVVLELVKEARYRRLDWSFSFVRTKDDVEIDLVIRRPGEPHLLVEIKSKERVTEADAKALETLGRDLDPHSDRWILSRDPLEQRFGGTRALNWQQALRELFG